MTKVEYVRANPGALLDFIDAQSPSVVLRHFGVVAGGDDPGVY